jgi:hypothetical protein
MIIRSVGLTRYLVEPISGLGHRIKAGRPSVRISPWNDKSGYVAMPAVALSVRQRRLLRTRVLRGAAAQMPTERGPGGEADSRGAQGVQIGSGNVQHNHYQATPAEASAPSDVDIIEISIAPAGAADSFDVHVLQSPTGQASVQVGLDVMRLAEQRWQLQQALLASTVQTRQAVHMVERTVQNVGRVLFTALLGTGDVVASYRATRHLADAQGHRLRIVLRIDDPALAALPWEMMYDPLSDTYVCRSEQLVRTVAVHAVCAPVEAHLPIRILAVDASPRGMPSLDLLGERVVLSQVLENGIADGRLELSWVPRATWTALQERLLDGPWHVVHFFGRGAFDPERDEGFLLLVDEDGRPDRVEAGRFADLLREARPIPPVVVLNACESGVPGMVDTFSGTATTLVRHGIATVAAMQYEISADAAVAFARAFYTALAHGRTVDEAVSSGRVGILGHQDATLEWITPALYVRDQRTSLVAGRTLGATTTTTVAATRTTPPRTVVRPVPRTVDPATRYQPADPPVAVMPWKLSGMAPDTASFPVSAPHTPPPPGAWPVPVPPWGRPQPVPVPPWGSPQPEAARSGTPLGLGPVPPGSERRASRRTIFMVSGGTGKRLALVCSLLFALSPLLTCGLGAAFAFGLAAVSVPRLHRWEVILLRTGTAVLTVSMATAIVSSGQNSLLFPGGPLLSGSALFVAVVGGLFLAVGIVICSMATGFLNPAGQAARQENVLLDSDPIARAALVSALLSWLILPIIPALVLAITAIIRSGDPKIVAPGRRLRASRCLAVCAIVVAVLWIATWSANITIDPPAKP